MKPDSLAVTVFGAVFLLAGSASAQTWTQTSAPTTNWSAVVCSADGSKVLATTGGLGCCYPRAIYLSTNAGVTWTVTSAPITNWTSLACSADGTRLVAACVSDVPPDYGGPIYASTNSGATWAPTGAPMTWWYSVASSADGTKLVANDYAVIHTSKNAGITWTPAFTNFGGGYYVGLCSVASSADGRVLVASHRTTFYNYSNELYTSTNSGATWATTTLLPNPVPTLPVASAADGSALFAAHGLWVYRSQDSGVTWTQLNVLVQPQASSIASSADGVRLVAGASSSSHATYGTYTSTDAGATWSPELEPITNQTFVASSADGGRLVAAVRNGGIWVRQTVVAPALGISASTSKVLVSCIVPSTDFVLQQNSDLNMTDWTDVAATPALNVTNLHYEVEVPLAGGNRFYRLKH